MGLDTKVSVLARNLVTVRVIERPRIVDPRCHTIAKDHLVVALDIGILVVVFDENVIAQLLRAIVLIVARPQRHGRIVRHVQTPAIVLGYIVGHVHLVKDGHVPAEFRTAPMKLRFILGQL
jgi:hypothetical protein